MTGTSLSPQWDQQYFDNNGNPLAGGFIYTYAAGTTTPLAAYTDSTGSIAQTNPIVLDGNGRAPVWLLNVGYKFVLKDANNVTIMTADQVNPLAIGAGSITSSMIAPGAVESSNIAVGGVETINIADGAVTAPKLAAGVGILPDLAVGPNQIYTTIGAAVAAATAGQSIYIRTGNYVENVTISEQLNIMGSGRGAIIAGTLTVATGGDFSIIQDIKVMGGITINSGVTCAQVINFWSASGGTVTDNGTGSFLQGIQE